MGWVAAQLSDAAAYVKVSVIERDLLVHVPQAELFFPAIADDELPSPLHPLSAYVFSRAALPVPTLARLQRSRFVEAVLRAGRSLAVISDDDLQRSLKVKLRGAQVAVGQRVMVLAGDWAGIEGRVCEVKRNGIVAVYIELRSVATVVAAATHEIQFL